MKNYQADSIRNIAVLGHGGEGKTTLTEAMLFNALLVGSPANVDSGIGAMAAYIHRLNILP